MKNDQGEIVLSIKPCPKPRQTQSDRWKLRPCVKRYRDFRDALRPLAEVNGVDVKYMTSLMFIMPMPQSWSKKKKAEMNGKLHLCRPDSDNLQKAFQDALLEEDSTVAINLVIKVWGYDGKIIVNPEDFQECSNKLKTKYIEEML